VLSVTSNLQCCPYQAVWFQHQGDGLSGVAHRNILIPLLRSLFPLSTVLPTRSSLYPTPRSLSPLCCPHWLDWLSHHIQVCLNSAIRYQQSAVLPIPSGLISTPRRRSSQWCCPQEHSDSLTEESVSTVHGVAHTEQSVSNTKESVSTVLLLPSSLTLTWSSLPQRSCPNRAVWRPHHGICLFDNATLYSLPLIPKSQILPAIETKQKPNLTSSHSRLSSPWLIRRWHITYPHCQTILIIAAWQPRTQKM
jgi:hypothetical protein